MKTISENLLILNNIKTDLKTTINELGGNADDNFKKYSSEIDNLDLANLKKFVNAFTQNGTSYRKVMYNYTGDIIYCNTWDLSKATDTSYMFYNCMNATSIDVSTFVTNLVKYMHYMFYGCVTVLVIDVSKFVTDNVLDMQYMFYDCQKITTLDVSKFVTTNVNNMAYMFYN